jgi:hypothetical protein
LPGNNGATFSQTASLTTNRDLSSIATTPPKRSLNHSRSAAGIPNVNGPQLSEVKRNIIVETLCAVTGKAPEYISEEQLAYMAGHGDSVMYPTLIKRGG